MKQFKIIHDNHAIHLDTCHTKFSSLERIIIVAASEFIAKGKSDDLRRIMGRIEAFMV